MHRHFCLAIVLGWGLSATLFADGPAETVLSSEQVLCELMAIPARQIPCQLLNEAQGIVIVPNVRKIGFIAGARRGCGVVMVRDADCEWSLPQFVSLTGGSVGFQAGIQDTDVVLAFMTRNGIEGLMRGACTAGVDASVAAGPVGRETAVGIDPMLRSDIYSYSRSRGLFLGVSLEGTALEIDHASHARFYGTPTGQLPARVPAGAAALRQFLADLTPPASSTPAHVFSAPVVPPRLIEGLRRSLNQSDEQLQALLSPEWQNYLALPAELEQPGSVPNPEARAQILRRFALVNSSPEYQHLAQRPEFKNTYELLVEIDKALSGSRVTLKLPSPPRE